MLRERQVLFTYLHLAPDPAQTKDLVACGATCIAYQTVTSSRGGIPLSAQMSKVAGRMSIQAGAYCVEHPHGELGTLLGCVPGREPAKALVLGGAAVGTHPSHVAVGMGADVWGVDRDNDVLENHWPQFGRATNSVFATHDTAEKHVLMADLVICGVLIPGAATPRLTSADMIKAMKPGAVLSDVATGQGGCSETSRATTHADST